MDSETGDLEAEHKALREVMERHSEEALRLYKALFGTPPRSCEACEAIEAILSEIDSVESSASKAVGWSRKSRSWMPTLGGSGMPVSARPPKELRTELTDYFESRWG